MKKSLLFALLLITGAQIVNIGTLPIPIILYPKRIFAFIISILISYCYTRFYKFKFSPQFIVKSFIWHFIFCFAIPIVLFLSFTDIKFVQLKYLNYSGFSGCFEQEIFISLVTFVFNYAILFLCCWLGNRLAIRYITKDTKPITLLQEPLLFASMFVFVSYLITSSMRISLNNIPMPSHAAVLFYIYAGNEWDVSRLLIALIASFFIAFFSFAYTLLYQKKMSVQFKMYAIIEIALILFLFQLLSLLSASCGFSHLLEQIHHFSGNEFITLLTNLIINLTNLKILIALYLLISGGNRLALWIKRYNILIS